MVSQGWTWNGIDNMTTTLKVSSGDIVRAVGQSLSESAQLVMRESQRQVPVRDGYLIGSGTVNEPKFSNGFVKVTMGYGGAAAKYALYVHNSPYEKNWTKPGTKSHFLSDPLAAATVEIQGRLAKRIGGILGKGSVS